MSGVAADSRLVSLAGTHRRAWARPGTSVIAVTGTSGKYTICRMVAALVARATGRSVLENGSERTSLRDLALCLLSLRAEHVACVLEVSAQRRGDIARMTAMIEPDVGALTLVDHAHVEALGTIENISREKAALLRGARAAYANADDPRAVRELRALGGRAAQTWGHGEDAGYRVDSREPRDLLGSRIRVARPDGSMLAVDAPVFGQAGARAVAASIALAEGAVGGPLAPAVVSSALHSLAASSALFLPRVLPDNTAVLVDCADATPSSFRSAIAAASELATLTQRRLLIVAGAMSGLADRSAVEHVSVGLACVRAGAHAVIACGAAAEPIGVVAMAHAVPAALAHDSFAAANAIATLHRPGDFILLAGGRTAPTQFLAEALTRRAESRKSPCAA